MGAEGLAFVELINTLEGLLEDLEAVLLLSFRGIDLVVLGHELKRSGKVRSIYLGKWIGKNKNANLLKEVTGHSGGKRGDERNEDKELHSDSVTRKKLVIPN